VIPVPVQFPAAILDLAIRHFGHDERMAFSKMVALFCGFLSHRRIFREISVTGRVCDSNRDLWDDVILPI
jgi:hypothetical protein